MRISEWKTYRLGDLIEVNKKSISKNFEFDAIEYFDTSSVTANKFSEPTRLLLKEAPSRAKRIVEHNDVLYSTVRPNQLHYGIIKNPKPNTIVSTGFAVLKAKGINPEYLFYYLTQNEIVQYLNSIAETSTTTFPAFNPSNIEDLEAALPDLKTQQRIASILSSLDDAIELNQQINKTLEEMAKAIFKEWFVDFNFPNATGKFQETEIGKIPLGWKKGTIEDLLFHSKDSVNPSKQPDEDFYHYSIPAYDEGNNPSVEKGNTILSNKFQVKNNSILVSKLNPRFPRTWAIGDIEEERSICSTEFQVLVPKKSFYYSYGLWLFAQTFVIDKMKASATGTSGSHQRVRPQDILDIEIPLPNDEVLKLYHDTVSAFSRQIDDNKKENQSLINLRDTLLPKLMKGEININL